MNGGGNNQGSECRGNYFPRRFVSYLQQRNAESVDAAKAEEGRKNTKARWDKGNIVVTGTATVIIAILTGATVATMRGQLRVMEIDQRPWATLTAINVASPLTYPEPGIANMGLQFAVKNLGKTPVVGVLVDVFPTVQSDTLEHQRLLKERCTLKRDEFRKSPRPTYNILPQDTYFQWSRFTNHPWGDYSIHIGPAKSFIALFIGRITYGDSFASSTIHQTGVMGGIAMKDDSRPHEYIAINVADGEIAADRLRSMEIHTLGFAD